MALRCFVEELNDACALKPILPQLMDSVFKLMSEVSAVSRQQTGSVGVHVCRTASLFMGSSGLERMFSAMCVGTCSPDRLVISRSCTSLTALPGRRRHVAIPCTSLTILPDQRDVEHRCCTRRSAGPWELQCALPMRLENQVVVLVTITLKTVEVVLLCIAVHCCPAAGGE